MKRLEIVEYLLQNGFTEDCDVFTKIGQQQVGEMIVNGRRQIQVQNIEIKITFIGNGWIGESEENSDVTTQWNLSVNGVDQGDFIVETLEEFKKFFKL
jgi:hypothetical protein